MKQYLLSVYGDESQPAPSPEVMQQMFKDVDAFNNELKAEGAWIFAGGLFPPSSATTVRLRDDSEVYTTDGPYTEAKEQIGGFWVVQAPDFDAALALGKRGARACQGGVEVRPFQDEPEA